MLLVGKNGTRFELRITGYQFPAIVDDEWDSNWLNIWIDVASERGSWSAADPSLLTGDVESLADWLEAVAEGRGGPRELDFLEPNLSFELRDQSGDDVTLRVWFELEFRPPWAPEGGGGERDLWVDLDVPKHQARRSAGELREQLEKFPARGVAG